MRNPGSLIFILLPLAILLLGPDARAQSSAKIVYADDPGRIQVTNGDGTGQTMLTAGGSILDDDPVYSPDGSKIAFSRMNGFKSEVCIMNADGLNVVSVTSANVEPESFNRDPSWSPDGTKIAFVSKREALADTELDLMNPDGSDIVRLTNDNLDDNLPAWSPDSQRIAFSKSNGAGIHIINRDGTNLVSVINFSSWPAWSPDGSRIAFSPLGAPASNLSGPNFTPPFPACPSGHAGFGGALFQTLRRFYGKDKISFTFISDEFNGVTADVNGIRRPLIERSFSSPSEAEEENGQSRIYLGIHWRFDKTAGIKQGNTVANYVFDRLFRRKHGDGFALTCEPAFARKVVENSPCMNLNSSLRSLCFSAISALSVAA